MDLVEKVKNLYSGEDVINCNQCGMCSGSCPLRFAMDLSPTQVIRLVQVGSIERILTSNTHWICSTCFNCYAQCPRKISVTNIMEALRQIKLRRDQDHINLGEISKEELSKIPPIALVSNFRKTTA
jgi:heterodisulfide reductase subunit C